MEVQRIQLLRSWSSTRWILTMTIEHNTVVQQPIPKDRGPAEVQYCTWKGVRTLCLICFAIIVLLKSYLNLLFTTSRINGNYFVFSHLSHCLQLLNDQYLVFASIGRKFLETCTRSEECISGKQLTCRQNKCLCYTTYYHKYHACYPSKFYDLCIEPCNIFFSDATIT